MAAIFVIIGLLFSGIAFGVAIFNLHRMVEKHKIHPTISDEKFILIRNTFASMAVATILIYLTLVAAGAYIYLNGNTVNGSLCALRDDLQTRVTSSKTFLEGHPKGIPGISRATIEQGIENQERTIEALSNLNC